MTFKMDGMRVKIEPPDVCYMYPTAVPPYERKSSSLFTVTVTSRSVPVAYKLMCFKHPDMKVKIEERENYKHFPADSSGTIKTSNCKIFKVTLLEGYDPIQGKDDGFNVLVAMTPADRAALKPKDWWKDEYIVTQRVDFQLVTGQTCLPDKVVNQTDDTKKHPGRVLSGFLKEDGTETTTLLPQPISNGAQEVITRCPASNQEQEKKEDGSRNKTGDSGIRHGSGTSTDSPDEVGRGSAKRGEHITQDMHGKTSPQSSSETDKEQVGKTSKIVLKTRTPSTEAIQEEFTHQSKASAGTLKELPRKKIPMTRTQSTGGQEAYTHQTRAPPEDIEHMPRLPSLAGIPNEDINPAEEIKRIDQLIKNFSMTQARVDGLFLSALTALERVEQYHTTKM